MKHRGVEGGTPASEPLCRSCGNAIRMQGSQQNQQTVRCYAFAKLLEFEAVECTAYRSKHDPALMPMFDVAWTYEVVDEKGNKGFVPKEIRRRMHYGIDAAEDQAIKSAQTINTAAAKVN